MKIFLDVFGTISFIIGVMMMISCYNEDELRAGLILLFLSVLFFISAFELLGIY